MQKIYKSIQLVVLTWFLMALFSSASLANNMDEKVNINQATANQLQQIDGIGKTIAGRIIEFRETYGPFKTIDEVKKVKGIGEKIFEKIKLHLDIGIKQSLDMR